MAIPQIQRAHVPLPPIAACAAPHRHEGVLEDVGDQIGVRRTSQQAQPQPGGVPVEQLVEG